MLARKTSPNGLPQIDILYVLSGPIPKHLLNLGQLCGVQCPVSGPTSFSPKRASSSRSTKPPSPPSFPQNRCASNDSTSRHGRQGKADSSRHPARLISSSHPRRHGRQIQQDARGLRRGGATTASPARRPCSGRDEREEDGEMPSRPAAAAPEIPHLRADAHERLRILTAATAGHRGCLLRWPWARGW